MIRAFLLFCLLQIALWGENPEAFYLTWEKNPESSVVVNWLSKTGGVKILHLRKEDGSQGGIVEVSPVPLQDHSDYFFYQVSINDLAPEALYELRLEGVDQPFKWRTLPAKLSRSIKFIVGGDIYHDGIKNVEEMNQVAAKLNPDFALLGGDIAYTSPKLAFLGEDEERWIDFLRAYTRTMVKEDGTLIPLMAAVGNHDVLGRFDASAEKAKLFYRLFIPEGVSYRVLDVANHFSIIFLDTDHTFAVNKQVPFLEETLKNRESMPVKFALYHVPAYPSVRAFHNARSARVRRYFVPLFEKYHLTAAFENHDHAYKRTSLIREGKVNPEGVLYLGDGSWGVEAPRQPRTPKQSWYIAKSAKVQQVLLVTVNQEGNVYESYDFKGGLVDRYSP